MPTINPKPKPAYAVAGDLVIVRPAEGKTLWSIQEVPRGGGMKFDHVTISESRTAAEARAKELGAVTGARVFRLTGAGKLVRVEE